MDRSLRRRGQLLVVVGALLGAVVGVALALVVEDAETSRAVAAPGLERGMAPAASPPSSQAPPQAATAGRPADGSDSSGEQTKSADRPNRHDGKAGKNSGDSRDKPADPDKGKPGKSKGTHK